MKAIVYHQYGGPDVLQCEQVEKPAPGDDQVLIRVRAASINPLDTGLMKGEPYLLRLFFGWPRPRITRPGRDVAGVVEALGKQVTRFKAGDEVFGLCTGGSWRAKADGSFAEFACTLESALAAKPPNISFDEAAAVPVAGLSALQGLRDKCRVQPGHKVLINGAGGGVGTFAVQIAKALGAEVTAVSNGRNLVAVRALGADSFIDYTSEDFCRRPEKYDAVFDCYSSHSPLAIRRVLNPKGVYLVVGGPTGNWAVSLARLLVTFFIILVLSPFTSRKLATFLARSDQKDLDLLREMMADGRVRPVVDRSYALSEVANAMRHLEQDHPLGKVVISLGS